MKSVGSYERSVFLLSGLNYPKHPIFWESLFCNKINKGLPVQGLEGLKKFLHSTGRKKGSNTGESISLSHIFLIRWSSLVLPIHGFPRRVWLMLVSAGFGSERFLSPQDHTNQSMVTRPLPWPWLSWERAIKVWWSVVIKHILLGRHFANTAFVTSCYTFSKQPVQVCLLAPALTETKGRFCDGSRAKNANIVSVWAPNTLGWHISPSIFLQMKRFRSFQRCLSVLSLKVSYWLFLSCSIKGIFKIVLSYRHVWFRANRSVTMEIMNFELWGKPESVLNAQMWFFKRNGFTQLIFVKRLKINA